LNTVIIGATAGLGLALSERLAGAGSALFLVASDQRDLAAVSADLSLRYGVAVNHQAVDLATVDATQLADQIVTNLGGVDTLFYIAGVGDAADCGPVSDDIAVRLMAVNFIAAVSIINALQEHLAARTVSNIVGIGSVAEIRGRNRNMIYGAAKRGLEVYFASLRHRLATTGCHVQFYRLGFMKTSMLSQASPWLPAIAPDAAAEVIFQNLGRDCVGRYLPRWWLAIAIILKLLPWPIFRRLDI